MKYKFKFSKIWLSDWAEKKLDIKASVRGFGNILINIIFEQACD